MFEVKRTGDNRLDITMSGKLDTAAMKIALQQLVTRLEGIENGLMLYDVVDYNLPTLKAVIYEFSKLPGMMKFIRQFSRAAVLTDMDWIRRISEFESIFLPWLQIKGFTRDRKDEAEAWLEEAD
jgi:hypothetical protein